MMQKKSNGSDITDVMELRKIEEYRISEIAQKIEHMDSDINRFLSRREDMNCPEYWNLVKKIHTYRVPGNIVNTALTYRLKDVQGKIQTYSNIWRSRLQEKGMNFYTDNPLR